MISAALSALNSVCRPTSWLKTWSRQSATLAAETVSTEMNPVCGRCAREMLERLGGDDEDLVEAAALDALDGVGGARRRVRVGIDVPE